MIHLISAHNCLAFNVYETNWSGSSYYVFTNVIMASSSSTDISEPYKKHLTDIKSSAVYDKWWGRYLEYAKVRNVDIKDITTFMNWMCSMKQTDGFAPSTVISAASCVNSKIKVDFNKNFMDHMLVKDIIRKLHKESAPTQASVFTAEQIEQFILNAPETMAYKILKIITMTAIQGALRVSEIVNLEYDDIIFLNNGSMSVRIKTSKTDTVGKGHTFIVTPNCNSRLCLVMRMKSYMDLLVPKTGRLFRSATKSEKVGKQPIGINTMGSVPRKIAEFLQLPNVAEYSGHSFRRTSATVLSEKGIGLVELKQHGRWKSTSVCERYVENTICKKMKTSDMIQNSGITQNNGKQSEQLIGGEATTFANCSFVNCNINLVNN